MGTAASRETKPSSHRDPESLACDSSTKKECDIVALKDSELCPLRLASL